MRNPVSIFIALTLFISFSAFARDINPEKLQRSAQHHKYELSVEYTSETTVARSSAAYVLMPGTYVRTFDAENGFYLVGDENSLEVRVTTPQRNRDPLVEVIRRRGAIFVPSDTHKGATLLFFLPQEKPAPASTEQSQTVARIAVPNGSPGATATAGVATSILSAILSARAGKMTVPKEAKPDARLRNLLVLRNEP